MSTPTTSPPTTNATSSPASEAGPSLCDGPDSKTPEESGPAPVPVSRFRALAKDRATPTPATFGPLFTPSSPSASLQSFLESRLRALTDANGSPEYALTWKTLDMPAGPPICALRASAPPTAASAYTGWATPVTCDLKGPRGKAAQQRKGNPADTLSIQSALTPWPTPEAEEARRGFQNRNNGKRGTQKSLTTVAVESLTPWPTPQCMDTLPPMDYERRLNHPSRPGRNVSGNLREVVTLAAWPTPQEDNANNSYGHKGTAFSDLPTTAQTAAWATPRAEDAESAGMRHSRGVADTLSAQAGQDAASSSAATAKPAAYRLNPRFSLWLMGFPDAWASCGEQAMQSSRRSPKPSSAPGSPQPQTPQKGTRHETI